MALVWLFSDQGLRMGRDDSGGETVKVDRGQMPGWAGLEGSLRETVVEGEGRWALESLRSGSNSVLLHFLAV